MAVDEAELAVEVIEPRELRGEEERLCRGSGRAQGPLRAQRGRHRRHQEPAPGCVRGPGAVDEGLPDAPARSRSARSPTPGTRWGCPRPPCPRRAPAVAMGTDGAAEGPRFAERPGQNPLLNALKHGRIAPKHG